MGVTPAKKVVMDAMWLIYMVEELQANIKITTVLEKTKQFKQTRTTFLLFVVILYFPCILLTKAAFWLISSITSLFITHFITHQEACASQPVCCLLDLILPYFHFAIICWKVDQSIYIPE